MFTINPGKHTKQDIFNAVVFALRAQGKPATKIIPYGEDGSCARCQYRTPDDSGTILACAAGQLITDDEYRPGLEGSSIGSLLNGRLNTSLLAQWIRSAETPDERMTREALLTALQVAHDADGNQPLLLDGPAWLANFLKEAAKVARTFGLDAAFTTPDGLKVDGLDFTTATKQDVFDFVAFKLIQQGKQALDVTRGICVYRGPGNIACAVGKLIPDAQYEPKMECGSIISLRGMDFAQSLAVIAWSNADPSNAQFLEALQTAHDDSGAGAVTSGSWLSAFRERMRFIAKGYKLDASILGYREAKAETVAAPVPAAPAMGDQTIGDSVLAFASAKIGKQFHIDELRDYVVKTTGHTTPDTPRRVLSLLRRAGKVGYTLISRSQSLYRIDAVI